MKSKKINNVVAQSSDNIFEDITPDSETGISLKFGDEYIENLRSESPELYKLLVDEKLKYKKLLNTIPNGIILIDENFKIIDINNFASSFLSINNINPLDSDLRGFLLKENFSEIYIALESFVRDSSLTEFNINITSENNQRNEINISFLRIILNQSTALIRIIIQNCNYYGNMENQLYNTNTFLESVLNSFGVHIFRVDKNFIITYVNNYFAENISKNQSEIIGKSINEIFKTHLAKQYIIDIEDIFSSGVQKISYEDHSSQNCRHKGFVEAIKSPFYDEFGNFNEVQISILAISDRYNNSTALNDLEYKFRKFFNDSSDLIIVTDKYGNVSFVGDNCSLITGFVPEEFLEINLFDHIHKEDIENIVNVYKNSFSIQGVVINSELRFRHKNGNWIWLGLSIKNLVNDEKINGIITNAIDITKRKNAEHEKEETELRYKQLFELLPDGIVILDPESTIPLEFNEAAYKMLGYTSDEFAKLRISEYEYNENEVETRLHFKNIISKGYDEFETNHICKDGTIIPTFLKVKLIELRNQTYLIGIIQDLSTIKKLQFQHDDNELKFKTLIENAFDGIYLLNDKSFTYTNNSFSQIIGYSIEEITSGNFELLNILTPQSRKFMMERSKKRNAGENVPKSFELELITKNGEYKTIEIGTETIEVNNQKSVLGFVRDITDRKNMEIEIQKGKELAEKSAEIANTILNNLGHELRTPLNGILGFSRILRSEISDEDHNEMLRLIEISGERLKKTLGTLLILTELDSEKYRIILEKCNLKSIVNDYDMSTIDQVKVKDIKYRIIIEDDNLCIKSDQYLLQQAIYNILDNAYKFTEQGNITLKVYKETEKAVIEISDTGIGIEEEKLNIIYEPFRQVSEGIQRKYEGVGIGLTIVRRILEQINGNIEIESKVNVGTTIRLIFDCCNE